MHIKIRTSKPYPDINYQYIWFKILYSLLVNIEIYEILDRPLTLITEFAEILVDVAIIFFILLTKQIFIFKPPSFITLKYIRKNFKNQP